MLPADKKLFGSLKRECTLLHAYWKVYRQLYAKSDKRVQLLNESGSLVFHMLQHLLLNEVTLALSRLTDPPRTHGKANHSIPRLLQRVDGRTHPKLKADLKEKYSDLKENCKDFRTRRNKAVAHSDLAAKLQYTKDAVPGISQQKVEDALAALRNVLNAYDYYFNDNTTVYEEVTLALGSDGDFLVSLLKRAQVFKSLEKSGEIDRGVMSDSNYKDA